MPLTLRLTCATAASELRKDAAAALAARLAAWSALPGRALLRLDTLPRTAEPRHSMAGRLVTVTLHVPTIDAHVGPTGADGVLAAADNLPALLGAHWTLVALDQHGHSTRSFVLRPWPARSGQTGAAGLLQPRLAEWPRRVTRSLRWDIEGHLDNY